MGKSLVEGKSEHPGGPGMLKGGLRGLLNKDDDKDAKAIRTAKVLEKEFPIVAEILGGCAATSTEPSIAPGSVKIEIREGRATFCAVVKSSKKVFYGEVADLLNPFGSINSAFLLGEVTEKELRVWPSSSEKEAEVPH